jgi:hypothetical protein
LLLGYKNQLGVQLECPKGIRGMHDVVELKFTVIDEHRELIVEPLCSLLNQCSGVLAQDDGNVEAIVERQSENADERARLSALDPERDAGVYAAGAG